MPVVRNYLTFVDLTGFVEQDSTLFRAPLLYALLRNLEISVYPRRPYMLSIQSSFHAVYPR